MTTMMPAAMNPYILPAPLSGLPATIAFASTILSQIFSLGLSFCDSGCCSRAPSAYKLVHVQKVSPESSPSTPAQDEPRSLPIVYCSLTLRSSSAPRKSCFRALSTWNGMKRIVPGIISWRTSCVSQNAREIRLTNNVLIRDWTL